MVNVLGSQFSNYTLKEHRSLMNWSRFSPDKIKFWWFLTWQLSELQVSSNHFFFFNILWLLLFFCYCILADDKTNYTNKKSSDIIKTSLLFNENTRPSWWCHILACNIDLFFANKIIPHLYEDITHLSLSWCFTKSTPSVRHFLLNRLEPTLWDSYSYFYLH